MAVCRFQPRSRRRFWLLAGLIISLAVGSGLEPRRSAAQDRASEESQWSTLAPLAPRSLLLDATTAGDRIVVVGERGHVLLSGPGQADWTQIRTPTRSTLTAVTESDGQFWAVGHDTTILHSADGGLSWTKQHSVPGTDQPLFDVWFEDGGHGLAVGAYGLFLETWDRGATWRRRSIDNVDLHFYAIAETHGGVLILVGEFGLIYRSTDRAATWQRMNSPYEGSLFGALVPSDDAILVFGLRGHVFRSDDGGETWRPIETGTIASLFAGVQRADKTVVIAGQDGVVLTSADLGQSFQLAVPQGRRAISTMIETDRGELLRAGEGGLGWIDGPLETPSDNRSQP
jgi:photosystem II stability/assembly factor-like uncharacterized protein